MSYHVIAAPRSGATAYALMISQQLDLEFINEPYKFGFMNKHFKTNTGLLGNSNEYEKNYACSEDHVCHHLVSQYVSRFTKVPDDHEIIIIERKDKWAQLISYCVLGEVFKNTQKIHNIDYDKTVITVKPIFVQRMFYEWLLLDQFKLLNNRHQLIYYEDINYVNITMRKNTGYENIEIQNMAEVKDLYEQYLYLENQKYQR
jgi:hypothetical protein